MVEGTSQALSVHRCRFVDYTPSSIGAVAFAPLPLPNARDAKKKKLAGTSRDRKFGTLAVGRSNGNIELCEWSGADHENQAPQAWTIFKILYGPQPSKVDSLVFTLRYPYQHSYNEVSSLSDLRLFSAGGGSELVEWDLSRGTILRTINSQGGAIWSMAANPSSTLLALGCDDGSIRLLSLEHDTLSHYRRFDRIKSRILSIAWGPPVPPQRKKKERRQERTEDRDVNSDSDDSDDDDEEWTDSWIATGCSDNCVRKWDITSGRAVDRMTTDRARGEKTLVWAVGVLGDGTIISGDSLGTVKFWDSRTCTQSYSFQSHGADVLCLAVGPDGETVFTSGVDQKVCLFSLVKISKSNKNDAVSSALQRTTASTSRWVLSTSKRMHSHDVRTLAIWPPYLPLPPSTHRSFPSLNNIPSPFTDISPILASGGLDSSVVLAPCASASSTVRKISNPIVTSVLSNFEDAYHRRMAYTTGSLNPAIHVSRKQRLVVCASENKVSVWKVLGKPQKSGGEDLDALLNGISPAAPPQDDGPGFEKLLEMELFVTTNISASAISDDGHWLAISDVYETKLFELHEETVEGLNKVELRPKRVKQFMSILQPHLPKSSSSDLVGGSNGVPTEGASVLGFTPDSTRLIIATSLSASVIVVDLTVQPLPQVLRRFDHHRRRSALFGGRIIRGLPQSASGGPNGMGQDQENDERGDEDIEMKDAEQRVDEEDSDSDASSSSSSSSSPSSSSSASLKSLVTHLAISPDGQWLATTDTLNRTHIFSLDAVAYHTSLPTSHSPALSMSFVPPPAQPGTLLIVHADHTLTVFDTETKRTPAWAERLDRSILPKRFTGLHDPVLGIAFDWDSPPSPSEPSATSNDSKQNVIAIFWGATWLCRVELGPTADLTGGSWGGFSKKRPRDRKAVSGAPRQHGAANANAEPSATAPTTGHAEVEETNFKVITRYRPLLFANFLGPNEFLVIERPLIDVLSKLPPAFFKAKFGS